ncbi:MAG: putative Ig domain-containing protein [Acidobacteriota bacterium]
MIAACNIAIAPTTLPGGNIGTPYSQLVTASGGAAPYTFTVTAGAPPVGLTVSSAGLVSGTPAAAGVFGFTITAVDSGGCAGSRDYAIAIAGASGTIENIVVGAGLGQPNPNRVRIFRQDGTPTTVDFMAYSAGQWGVNVASGTATGGALAQIFTGPGPGPVYGPQVRGFLNTGSAMSKINFYAYGTLRFGTNVVAADVDDDGYDELVTGAGPGAVFGPHVRGFAYDNTAISAIAKISFFAYGTLKYGVNVASGSVDADPYGEILTGPGPSLGFGPQVRGWNYDDTTVTPIGKINFNAFAVQQMGANVAGGDVDADSYAEISCTPGPGAGPSFPSEFRGFDYDGNTVAALAGFDVTLPVVTTYGGRVALGDVTADGAQDLIAGAGRDPAATAVVRPYLYAGGQLAALLAFDGFAGSTYGVNVAGGTLGY